MKKITLSIIVAISLFSQQCDYNDSITSNLNKSISKPDSGINAITYKESPNDTRDYVYNPTKKKESVFELFQKEAKKEQKYLIRCKSDTTLKCKAGTKIIIKKNSFEFEDGSPIQDDNEISILIKEFYTISDMIKYKLNTISNGELLETGGMFYIEAFSNNKKLKLKESSTIGILPSSNNYNGMELFTGTYNNNQLNWIKNNKRLNRTNKTRIEFDKIEFCRIKDESTLQKLIKKSFETIDNKITGSVVLDCWVTSSGYLCKYEISSSPNEIFTKEVSKVFNKKLSFVPARVNDKYVCSKTRVWVNFMNENNDEKVEIKCLKESLDTLLNEVGSLTKNGQCQYCSEEFDLLHRRPRNVWWESSLKEMSPELNKMFESSTLGWINCDRFLKIQKDQLTDINIIDSSKFEVQYFAVFHKIKSLMTAWNFSNKCNFRNVPIGYNISVFGIKEKNGKSYFSKENIIVERNMQIKPNFIEATKDEIKKEIEMFN